RGFALVVTGPFVVSAVGVRSTLGAGSAGAPSAAKPSRPPARERINANKTRMFRKPDVLEDIFFMRRNQFRGWRNALGCGKELGRRLAVIVMIASATFPRARSKDALKRQMR